MKAFVVDFEASGLQANSYPIELGWCALGSVQSQSFLIRPAPQWRSGSGNYEWDEVAETIHGISREMVEGMGHSVLDVVETFSRATQGAVLISDGVEWDSYWLGQLFSLANKEPPQLISVAVYIADQVLTQGLDGRGVARSFGDQNENMVRPHRAGADAQVIAALVSTALCAGKLACCRFCGHQV